MKVNQGPDNPRWKGGRSGTYVQGLYPTEGKVCEGCGSDSDIVRHHDDEDRTNNDPSNIKFLCRGCHTRHHHKGKPKNMSEAGKANISAANTGNEYWLGRKHSDHSRSKMSASQKRAVVNRRRGPDGKWLSSK